LVPKACSYCARARWAIARVCANERVDRARLETAFEQMQAVCADVLDAELIGRRVMVAGKAGDRCDTMLARHECPNDTVKAA
jgi:hypothetical protein